MLASDPGRQPDVDVSAGLWLVAYHGALVRGRPDVHPCRFLVGTAMQVSPGCSVHHCSNLKPAPYRSFYYVKSYADGSGIVRLPAGIV